MRFPDWCPSPLRNAYLTLEAEASDLWIPADELKLRMVRFSDLSQLSESDQLRGIGDRSTTLKVIGALGSDLRMKTVWSELSSLELEAREGRIERVLKLGNETVCCGVASRCAHAMSDNGEVATRASWKARHEAVARAAEELSELLKPSRSLDVVFQNIAAMFSEKQFYDVTSELRMNMPDGELDLNEMEESSTPETEEEIKAGNERWEIEVKDFAYWVEQAMTRAPIPAQEVLTRMAELAKFAAERPPFLPPSSIPDRQIFSICGGLFSYFKYHLGRPLDNCVATIASVVVSQEVTTESVKMRRQRWRQHQQKG